MIESPEEKMIAKLEPFMRRRMAMLSLAGARFKAVEWPDRYVWEVYDAEGNRMEFGMRRSMPLVVAINNVWRDAVRAGLVDPLEERFGYSDNT